MGDISKQDNKNTLKKTKFDLRIIEAYLRKVQEGRRLLDIPVEELDEHLANFICTHRKQDGSEYEPGTLRGILGSLDRHFDKSNYPFAIYRSKETKFLKTVKAMKEKQSYLKTIGKGNHPNHAEPLSEREIELLYSTGAIGLHNPTALLHMLFFNIGLHFSLRSMEQHSLKWGDIRLKADPQGRKYLEHTKKLAPSRSGKAHPTHTMRMQIYESPEQQDRDVVRAYQKYASERPEKMKQKDAPFYLTPQPDCRPGYASWFKNLPMGETRIRSIMKNLKMAAGLPPQKRIATHCTARTTSSRARDGGGNPGTRKTKRGNVCLNGMRKCAVSVPVKVEENTPDAAPYSDCSSTKHTPSKRFCVGSKLSAPRGCSPSQIHKCNVTSSQSHIIKQEWDPKPVNSAAEENIEDKSFLQGPVSVTFHDVAACFSAEEWRQLKDWQKELYRNVMREIHSALQAMGYSIVNSDVLLKIKDEESFRTGHNEMRAAASDAAIPVSPDILLRIKQDEETDWRDKPEREEELSDGLPVFDPDLSLWIFREDAEFSSSEEAKKDQTLPGDADAEAAVSFSSLFKEPTAEISAFCSPMYPEGPRAGKRKRRAPQRHSSEQRPDSDNEDLVRPQKKFRVCEKQDGIVSAPHEKLYQCDLCDKSFSDRSSLLRTSLPGMPMSCPQCGGLLNLHPLYSRPLCTDLEGSFAQLPSFSDPLGEPVYAHPMQGPVG
ncbi:uncharacterized protein LOC128655852 [Bombina bombina]|uniref:uncharacterized protein LOC128655852 n=1 Tax=Bombina bombina TaxID=8345 RepID=UPI00235AD6C9|nr:uncharacterized protein LOC128655852 [Bombina bombina]